MAGTVNYRPAGPTVALSVTATLHTAVPITFFTTDIANYVLMFNSGTTAVAVQFSQTGVAATLPVDGTPGSFTLPPAANPYVIPLPNGVTGPPQVTAIGSGAGPSIIYVTPLVMNR